MLPQSNLQKSNFADGMIFNPDQIKVNDLYYKQKDALLACYGVGVGILVGYRDSLQVKIENSQLVLYPGALITSDGNIVIVPQKHIILKDLVLTQFKDETTMYVYIKYKETLTDAQDARKDREQKHFYKIEESFSVELREKTIDSADLFELVRFAIDHKSASQLGNPKNPYSPAVNEVDIRFCSRVSTSKSVMNYNEKVMVANIFRKYADFLTELAYRKRVISSSIAASFSNKIVGDLEIAKFSAIEMYETLQHLLYISTKIKDEIPEIIGTGFWKNIIRLQSLFSFSESYDASYYDMYLNIDSSFFSKVLMHFGNAAIHDGNWDDLNGSEDETVKETRDYIKVGSADDCDIIIIGDDIAPFHAKLYKYKEGFFIEDVSETSGIYINAERLSKGMKRFIRHQDFTVLGKHGNVLNLSGQ
jgi:hypothetical protein